MSRRFWRYIEKVYKFSKVAKGLKDQRQFPQVSSLSCFMFAFWMFVLGERSINAFGQRLGQEGRRVLWDKVFGSRAPSPDTVGYCFDRFDLEGLRELLHHLYTTLQRNHVIGRLAIRGWRAVAVDGHELFSSYIKHCDKCCERTVHTKKGDRTQYYHKVVVAQLVGGTLALPLDLEPILPGEGEVEAAARLIERLSKRYPKALEIVTADAIYANAKFLKLLKKHHKHLVAVLKENHPDILKDAKALFWELEPMRSKQGNTELERWDLQGFHTWPQAEREMRVVRSRETTIKKDEITESDWFWITEMDQAKAATESICRFGHARWDIENQGFNYMVNYLHMNHIFRHQPNAIIALLLVCFIAYILIQAFHQLNLKPQRRSKIRLLGVIAELSISFWADLKLLKPGQSKPRPP
jgi:hypothetical protein